jgi:hypothetical protein
MRISPRSILDSLVLDNLRVSVITGKWYMPVRLNRIYVPWILAGLASAVFFVRRSPGGRDRNLLLYLKSLFLPLAVVSPLFGQSLLGSVAPFCWLVLCIPQGDARFSHENLRIPTPSNQQAQFFPRALLCSVTVFQTLYAYPIAGAQYAFIEVLLIVVATICWGDFLLLRPMPRMVAILWGRRVIVAVFMFCVPLSYAVIAVVQHKTYLSLTPLDLPGAARIRLPTEQARDYHWLVRNLQASCDIFFGMPELPSLHIWTGSDPPAGMNVNDWMIVYDNHDQAAIAAALSSHPKACVYYNPRIIDFWNPSQENMSGLPLARYIQENFKVVGNLDDFSFLVRNDREMPKISYR